MNETQNTDDTMNCESIRQSLDFRRLRQANVTRCTKSYHSVNDWSPTDWACAAAGEMGELCNLIKKLRRGENVPKQDVAGEIADTIIYLDLLAARLGIDLTEAVINKFNETSQRRRSEIEL